MMKTIAFYLPQFHIIPENNEWWGEGFTEWTNVRNAKPQYKGHYQPEVPLKNDYYDLSDSSVMEKQVLLAKKYGIDAFCYYHYWFEGKLLLEKPLEAMLNNHRVDLPFMLCWANESWSRTWDGAEKKVLIQQNYNEDTEAIINHFNYLLPFFRDKRYIKHDNKPVFIIYKPHLIQNVSRIIELWDKMAINAGFSGLFIGFQHHSAFDHLHELKDFDFGIEFEPFFSVREMAKNNISFSLWEKIKKKALRLPTIYSYDEIWKRIISRSRDNPSIMPGAFTSWDNTPRMGHKAIVFQGASPRKFKSYFSEELSKLNHLSFEYEFIFINAWNEWAEGAHLEPDERNGYAYLEAVKESLG